MGTCIYKAPNLVVSYRHKVQGEAINDESDHIEREKKNATSMLTGTKSTKHLSQTEGYWGRKRCIFWANLKTDSAFAWRSEYRRREFHRTEGWKLRLFDNMKRKSVRGAGAASWLIGDYLHELHFKPISAWIAVLVTHFGKKHYDILFSVYLVLYPLLHPHPPQKCLVQWFGKICCVILFC